MGRKAGRQRAGQNPGGRGQRGRKRLPGPSHFWTPPPTQGSSLPPYQLLALPPGADFSLSQAFLLLRTLPRRASPQDWVLFLDERSFILSEWFHLGKESSPPADTQGSPPPPHHQVEHPRATQPHFVINHHYRWRHPKQTLPELPTPGATQNKPYLNSIHSVAKTHRGC